MPHKHKRQKLGGEEGFNLAPTSWAKSLPTGKNAANKTGDSSAPVKRRGKKKAPLDDTPRAFKYLMRLKETGKGVKSLDNGDRISKKRKRADLAKTAFWVIGVWKLMSLASPASAAANATSTGTVAASTTSQAPTAAASTASSNAAAAAPGAAGSSAASGAGVAVTPAPAPSGAVGLSGIAVAEAPSAARQSAARVQG